MVICTVALLCLVGFLIYATAEKVRVVERSPFWQHLIGALCAEGPGGGCVGVSAHNRGHPPATHDSHGAWGQPELTSATALLALLPAAISLQVLPSQDSRNLRTVTNAFSNYSAKSTATTQGSSATNSSDSTSGATMTTVRSLEYSLDAQPVEVA